MDTLSLAIGLAVGVVVGGLAGMLVGQSARRRAEERAVKAETSVEEVRKQLDEQKKLLNEATEKFKEAFKLYAGDALRESRADLLQAAEEKLGKVAEGLKGSVSQVVEVAKGDLDKRQEAIKGMVKPIEDQLKTVREFSEAMDRRRQEAYGSLDQQLKNLGTMQETLRTEARNLSTALRRPFVRGRWGEVTLRNLVEKTGMSPFCDFEEQVSTNTEEGRLRPDMVVRLPGHRTVVVDSKVPLEAYMTAMEATDEEVAKTALENHARQVRSHVTQLSAKKYPEQFPHALDDVILFIPGESFYSAALEADPELLDFSRAKHVILASPASFAMILSSVAYMWRQDEMEQQAQKIAEAGKQMYDRMRILIDNFEGIRRGLETAVGAFNKSVGSLESRVLPQARRFKDLGIPGADIAVVEPVEHSLRALPSGEFAATVAAEPGDGEGRASEEP